MDKPLPIIAAGAEPAICTYLHLSNSKLSSNCMISNESKIDYIVLGSQDPSDSGDVVDYIALWNPGEYTASVRVWPAISIESTRGIETLAFEPWPKGPVPVLEAENPELLAHFKWDGCADVSISPSGVMWHICDMEDIQELHRLLTWLHNRAPSFINCENTN